jgi:hypothetical protein
MAVSELFKSAWRWLHLGPNVTLNFFRPNISGATTQQPVEYSEPLVESVEEEQDEEDSQHSVVNEEQVVLDEQVDVEQVDVESQVSVE